MHKAILLAFTSPTSPADDETFNKWYDTRHLPDVVGLEGVVTASRYRIMSEMEMLPGVSAPPQSYLAIYELQAETEEELVAFTKYLRAEVDSGSLYVDPTLDFNNVGAAVALPIGTPLRDEAR